MSLINRQLQFYNYTVDVWRGNDSPAVDMIFPTPAVLTDFNTTYSVSATGVHCLFWSTPENDEPTPVGRTKAVNIFTMDRWKFATSVDIQDTDLIICTAGPNGFPQVGRVWLVQGNTQNHNTLSISNTQLIYGKLTIPPPDIVTYYTGRFF